MIGEESEFQEFCMSIPQVAPSPEPINSVEYHDQCSTFKENRKWFPSAVLRCFHQFIVGNIGVMAFELSLGFLKKSRVLRDAYAPRRATTVSCMRSTT